VEDVLSRRNERRLIFLVRLLVEHDEVAGISCTNFCVDVLALSISYFLYCLKKRRKRPFQMSGFDVGFVGLFGWRLNIQRKVVVYVTNVEAHVASYIYIYIGVWRAALDDSHEGTSS
jgi:hypothetical protein